MTRTEPDNVVTSEPHESVTTASQRTRAAADAERRHAEAERVSRPTAFRLEVSDYRR